MDSGVYEGTRAYTMDKGLHAGTRVNTQEFNTSILIAEMEHLKLW